MPITQDLGTFVAEVAKHGAAPEAREVAKIGFIDCVATMIAGAREEATQTLLAALSPLPPGKVRLWFGDTRTSASEAALLNGVSAHVLDYDDVALRGHPSATLVPAIVSQADELGSSGREMLDAYVAGYEVWANLVERETDMHHMKGWHPTGIFGPIAASAACAVLRKLDAGKAAQAIGLGASQSAGLMSNFGSMAKSFHAGRAAQAGVMAARLAAAGFTASPDPIEHPQGFLAAVSPQGRVDRETPAKLGETWRITSERLNIKKYPACYYTHRAIDAILDLLRATPVSARDVERVDVTISRENATVLRNHRPQTALAAKFSIEFAMAAAIVARNVGLKELDDQFVRQDAVQRLYERVHVTHGTDYDHDDSPGSLTADSVVITTRDGRRLESAQVRHATGHAKRPLARSDLQAKFMDCAAYGRYEGDAAALFEKLSTLESVASPLS